MNSKHQNQDGFGHIVIFLVIVVLAGITTAGILVVQNHKKVANLQANASQAQSAANLKATGLDSASPESPIAAPQKGSSSTNSQSSKVPAQSSTANQTPPPAQSTAPNAPKETGAITFSADGCHITAAGTPGLVLTGLVMTSNRHKGGPLASDGVKIPASGTVTFLVVQSDIAFDYSTYVVDAALTDAAGATIASNSTSITSHNCQ
jgi:hypothetical protein